jgi:hypothetical protein
MSVARNTENLCEETYFAAYSCSGCGSCRSLCDRVLERLAGGEHHEQRSLIHDSQSQQKRFQAQLGVRCNADRQAVEPAQASLTRSSNKLCKDP